MLNKRKTSSNEEDNGKIEKDFDGFKHFFQTIGPISPWLGTPFLRERGLVCLDDPVVFHGKREDNREHPKIL